MPHIPKNHTDDYKWTGSCSSEWSPDTWKVNVSGAGSREVLNCTAAAEGLHWVPSLADFLLPLQEESHPLQHSCSYTIMKLPGSDGLSKNDSKNTKVRIYQKTI